MPDSGPPRRPRARRRGLEILALAPFAVAQPLFDVLGREPDYFVAHGSRPVDLLTFTAIVYLAPPLVLALPVLTLVRTAPGLGTALHGVVIAGLAALTLLPPLDRLATPAPLAAGVSAAAGVLLAWLLERSAGLRSYLALLAPLTLVFPLLLLFVSPTSKLLRRAEVAPIEVEIARPAPVVVLLLDELPVVSLMDAERSIDAEHFPNFARLAATSHWFRNATAVTPDTNYAVPAIVTGRYPDRARAATASEYPESLFTLLGGSYELSVIETQTRLCPERLCPTGEDSPAFGSRLTRLLADSAIVYLHVVLPQPLSDRLPAVTATWTDFAGPAPATSPADPLALDQLFTVDRARVFARFLEPLRPRPRPTLHFLHLMLPHVPWAYLPSGREYWASLSSSAFAEGVAADSTWTEEAWLVAQGYQRHLLQVAYVDRLLGELLDRLEASGLADTALLIVTADHGLTFQPGQPGRRATEQNLADVMAVPLFIRTPGQLHGTVSDRNVELIDILPTIAESIGLELPMAVDGVSVFDDGPERTHKILRRGAEQGFVVEAGRLDAKYRALARKLELFAGGLFAIGPRPELLGRPVGGLPLGPPVEVEIRLDQPEHFRRVDPAAPYVPAHVFGRARWTRPPERLELALAVNGIVQAVTYTFTDRGGARFAALVPEESLVEGDNAIEVLVVEPAGGGVVLRPTIRNAAPRYALERGADGVVVGLVASDGTACRLDPAAVDGGFLRVGTGYLGWARDAAGRRPYVVVMAFADGRLIHTTTTGGEPPAASPAAGRQEFEGSGFRFNLPAALADSAAELRIFAVVGDRGSELAEHAAGGAATP